MIKPMLLKVYSDKVCLPEKVIIERKYDGVRALSHIKKCGKETPNKPNRLYSFYSRALNEYPGFENVLDDLENLCKRTFKYSGGIVFDGELYKKDMPLQDIISIARNRHIVGESNSIHAVDKKELQYYIFDVYVPTNKDLTQIQRKEVLDILFKDKSFKYIKKVPYRVIDVRDIMNIYKSYLSEGYEGAIVRTIDGKYEPGKRSSDVLKVKPFDMDKFKIVDFTEGTKKDEGAVVFILETTSPTGRHTFKAVPCVPYIERQRMYKDGKKYIGRRVDVKYNNLSKDGIPLKPKIII